MSVRLVKEYLFNSFSISYLLLINKSYTSDGRCSCVDDGLFDMLDNILVNAWLKSTSFVS